MLYSLFFLLFFANSGQTGELESSTVYLTWQQDPTQTMTIQWLTKTQTPPYTVSYQAAGEEEWHRLEKVLSFELPASYYLQRAELISLNSDTLYRFKIEPEGGVYQFRTMPSSLSKPVRFVVGGDMYHDTIDVMAKTCQAAAKTAPHFGIVGGDIAYAFGKTGIPQKFERWIEWIRTWHASMINPDGSLIPVLAAVGNHDVCGQFDQSPAQAVVFATLFPRPQKKIYSVLDFGSYLSLFLLDSGHAHPIGGAQQDWLRQALNQRKHILSKFAIYHVPAYPSIRPFANKQSANIRKYWVPLFEQYGLNAAFEHHDHAYKRTHPLLNNKVHAKGIVYIGDGAWGVDKAREPKSNRKRFYLAKFKAVRHFILVSLQDESRHFSAIDSDGNLIDEFDR